MVNFFAKVIANGQQLQGESGDQRYPGWIEVLAYDWGGQRAQVHQAGAGRQGRVTYRQLILRKRVDTASPLIFKALDQNEVCEVTLKLRKAGGEMEDYFEIKLMDALIVEVKQGNLAFGGETPEEEVSFSYGRMAMTYDAQDSNTGITRGGIIHEAQIFSS